MSVSDNSQGTVSRVIHLLGHLAENQHTSIKDVSHALGLPPSTCHRLLDILVREGIVERDPKGRRYRVGVEFFRIAALANQHFDIREVARPFLKSVVERCDETCVLSLYDTAAGRMMYAEKHDSSQLLRYQLPMNRPVSVLWGASGKAIAAYLSPEEIERLHASEAAAPASGEPLPPLALLKEQLRRVRDDGFAISFGQKIAGAVGINAPVFGVGGAIVGSLGVTIPEIRAAGVDMERLTNLVMNAAESLSEVIGGPKVTRTVTSEISDTAARAPL